MRFTKEKKRDLFLFLFLKIAHGILTVDPGPLAPEDVESISEEEISETEDIISVDMANMLVTDEVNDTLNETRTPSAHEDSIDMDQFEPILSGSSDIESEEDIDFQVILIKFLNITIM